MYISIHKRITTDIVDDSPDGRLMPDTKIGIAVGTILFCILLMSFYFVARHRKRRPPPTPEERANARTYERWSENLAGKGKSARISLSREHRKLSDTHTPYSPSMSEYTVVEAGEHVVQTSPIADIPHFPGPTEAVQGVHVGDTVIEGS